MTDTMTIPNDASILPNADRSSDASQVPSNPATTTTQLPTTPTSPPTPDPSPTLSPPPPPSSKHPQGQPAPFLTPPHPLSTSRYNRQLLVPSISIRGQEAISKAKVLIIGLGGLGSPSSLYLFLAGIGTLGLIDADTVDVSNLHRQILHPASSVGESKVRSAMRTLRAHNQDPGVRLVGYEMPFEARSGVGVVQGRIEGLEMGGDGKVLVDGGYDIILDCTDNPASRYLISDVCVALGRVLVTAAAQRAEAQLMRLCYPSPPPLGNSDHGPGSPCYRCIFPTPPAPETVHPCSEIGILGPVVGVMGTLMAMEVLKIITSSTPRANHHKSSASTLQTATADGGDAWRPSLLLYNALSIDSRTMFRSVGLRRTARKDCLACGDADHLQKMGREKITRERIESGQVDHQAFCGRVEDVRVLDKENRIDAAEFVERMNQMDKKSAAVVVDVREEVEYQLGARVEGSVNVPISRILSAGAGGLGDQEQLGLKNLLPEVGSSLQGNSEDDEKKSIYFVCQRGNDSQIAAKRFLDAAAAAAKSGGMAKSRWIGDVVGGLEALQRHQP